MFVKVAALFRRIFKVNKIFLESTIGSLREASHNVEIGWNPTGDATYYETDFGQVGW